MLLPAPFVWPDPQSQVSHARLAMRHPAVHAFCVWVGTGCVPLALSFDRPTSNPSLNPQRMSSILPQYLSLRQPATGNHEASAPSTSRRGVNCKSLIGGAAGLQSYCAPRRVAVPLGLWWYRWQSRLLHFHKRPALVPTDALRKLLVSLSVSLPRSALGQSVPRRLWPCGWPPPPKVDACTWLGAVLLNWRTRCGHGAKSRGVPIPMVCKQ